MLATSGPEGLDCSPRGDVQGFVRVRDDKTLLLPDRRGNTRRTRRSVIACPMGSLPAHRAQEETPVAAHVDAACRSVGRDPSTLLHVAYVPGSTVMSADGSASNIPAEESARRLVSLCEAVGRSTSS